MNTQGRFKTTQGQTAPQIYRKSNIRDAVHGGVAQDRLPRFRILSRFIFGDLLESTLGNNFCKKLEGSGWAGGKVEQKCSYVRGRPQTIPWWLRQKESACNAGELGLIPGSDPWVSKIPWRREWLLIVFLPGKSHGQTSLVGYSPWGLQRVYHFAQ